MKKIILTSLILVLSLSTTFADCKTNISQNEYNIGNLEQTILNIGEKIVNKSDKTKLTKLVGVLEKIKGKNDKQRGIIKLLKDYFNCKINIDDYQDATVSYTDGTKFSSLTLNKSRILDGGRDGYIGFKKNIENIDFSVNKEQYVVSGGYDMDYDVTFSESNSSICTNGMGRVKVYIPPYISSFQLVLQPIPINNAVVYVNYEPLGVFDETKAKSKTEIYKEYSGNETTIRNKFFDYFYKQHKPFKLYLNDVYSFLLGGESIRFIDNTKGGYLYLSFSQGSEIPGFRDYNKNYRMAFSYYLKFQEGFTDTMKNDILSKIPNGKTEPRENNFQLIENSCN